MTKICKRIGAILLALTLCFGTSLTAFAAEDVAVANETVNTEEGISPASTYTTILDADHGTITDNSTLTLTLNSTALFVSFKVQLTASSSGVYSVTLKEPDGTSHNANVVCNAKEPTSFLVPYAKAGVYTYHFDRISGATSASANVEATN